MAKSAKSKYQGERPQLVKNRVMGLQCACGESFKCVVYERQGEPPFTASGRCKSGHELKGGEVVGDTIDAVVTAITRAFGLVKIGRLEWDRIASFCPPRRADEARLCFCGTEFEIVVTLDEESFPPIFRARIECKDLHCGARMDVFQADTEERAIALAKKKIANVKAKLKEFMK